MWKDIWLMNWNIRSRQAECFSWCQTVKHRWCFTQTGLQYGIFCHLIRVTVACRRTHSGGSWKQFTEAHIDPCGSSKVSTFSENLSFQKVVNMLWCFCGNSGTIGKCLDLQTNTVRDKTVVALQWCMWYEVNLFWFVLLAVCDVVCVVVSVGCDSQHVGRLSAAAGPVSRLLPRARHPC